MNVDLDTLWWNMTWIGWRRHFGSEKRKIMETSTVAGQVVQDDTFFKKKKKKERNEKKPPELHTRSVYRFLQIF